MYTSIYIYIYVYTYTYNYIYSGGPSFLNVSRTYAKPARRRNRPEQEASPLGLSKAAGFPGFHGIPARRPNTPSPMLRGWA